MLINSVEIVVKKSRFIGLLYEVHSIDEVKEVLEGLKKEHKKARHIPYAYKTIRNLVELQEVQFIIF